MRGDKDFSGMVRFPSADVARLGQKSPGLKPHLCADCDVGLKPGSFTGRAKSKETEFRVGVCRTEALVLRNCIWRGAACVAYSGGNWRGGWHGRGRGASSVVFREI